MRTITRNDFINIFENISQVMIENEEKLCEMDAQMGDGDLGLTMRKGWIALSEAAKEMDETDIGKLCMKCGMKLSSTVPSTMGTLLASALLSAGKAVSGKEELSMNDFSSFLQGFCEGIQKRGKCQPGDRTVLDSLYPAAQTAKKHQELTDFALDEILLASNEGLANTKKMPAKFGKAAIFVAKSGDAVDQGALVGNLIIQCFCSYLRSYP